MRPIEKIKGATEVLTENVPLVEDVVDFTNEVTEPITSIVDDVFESITDLFGF